MTTAPDLIEPVVGFRRWRVVRDHLTSPFIPLRWHDRVVHAECYPANRTLLFGKGWLEGPHEAPHPRCKCGVYAYHRARSRGPLPDPGQVAGIVLLWGRIEVHRDGMRAQHARIAALAYRADWGARHRGQIGGIARELGVDLIEERALALAARKYGEPLPESLIP